MNKQTERNISAVYNELVESITARLTNMETVIKEMQEKGKTADETKAAINTIILNNVEPYFKELARHAVMHIVMDAKAVAADAVNKAYGHKTVKTKTLAEILESASLKINGEPAVNVTGHDTITIREPYGKAKQVNTDKIEFRTIYTRDAQGKSKKHTVIVYKGGK